VAEHIRVEAPGGDYDIVIEPGLLWQTQRLVNEFRLGGKVVVATNNMLAPIYGEQFARELPNAVLVTIPDGEQYKTPQTVEQLYHDFVRADLDRSGTVIALGGGVVGDTVGFAAATYMRGVGLVQVPTSLLAIVDSSVGGKVGVDLPEGKNLVGAFKQPDAVLIDPDVLETLPERERRCGMAEVIKHGLLADVELLNPDLLCAPRRINDLVRRAIRVKVDIVQADPYEQNIRAHLNLGHTFAHAIEQASGYRWLHGEAVAVGLLAAVRLSLALELCDEELVERVQSSLALFELPRTIGDLDPGAICAAMATDKKWKDGHSRFVLLRRIGEPVIEEDVSMETVIEVLETLK
jgi:3-dehydroquinate synthase